MTVSPAPDPSRRKKVRLIVLLSAAVLLLVCAGVVWRRYFADPEPGLPPEQQIRRNFRQTFDPEESTLDRLASLRRSFRAVRSIPAKRRHEAIVEAMAESIDLTLQDFARLPADRKAARAELLRQDAERTRKYFRSRSKAMQKKALALLTGTPGGRAQFNNVIDTAATGLSPEDRRLLGPTMKIWKSMLEPPR